jgi:hypothetical protein
MDKEKTDLLLRYTLAVAGQNDEYADRQLGPIHLIKYAYIADLAYAQTHDGQSFTGVKWRFHKFGPWSPEIYERLDPALSGGGATKTESSHPKYEDDFIRWSLVDDEIALQFADQLPLSVSLAVQNAVRCFGSDTASLLNHVYLTRPMLCAAPGEFLDLGPDPKVGQECAEPPKTDSTKSLSKKDREERRRKLEDLRSLVRERIQERKKEPEMIEPDPAPRYDEVFQKGLAALDLEAGTPLEERKEDAIFSEDVWKSPARYDPELP